MSSMSKIESAWVQAYSRPVIRARIPALFLATLPALLAPREGVAADPEGRYPVWPTEIDRIAAPLRDPGLMTESARLAALEELEAYATDVILTDLELALTDPSPEVRNRALQICANRRVLACVDEAEAMWEDGEGTVRLMALELLSQDPSKDHLELVYEAMRDPNDLIREHAITLLVDAPLEGEAADEARREIVAQLGDISARVRKTAARSLGRLGPGEGALALVRLLDDIDVGVAEAAAFGLGQLADPRTAPALERALERPNNANFASAAVRALARLPGDEIDRKLLELLDTPPRNTRRPDIARAIGNRPAPGPALIAGLVERMRDPDLRTSTINALLWMGDLAVPHLEAALAKGLEPDIAIEVQRLLDARALERTPASGASEGDPRPVDALRGPLPDFADREAWFDRMGDAKAIEAGAALGERNPEWLGGALAWHLDRAAGGEPVRPWLMALAVAPEPVLDASDHDVTWGRIAHWAADEGAESSLRCLATLALGRAEGTRHDRLARDELHRLAGAHVADVRGCAALSLARFGDDPLLEALLADPSPRVRSMAALAHRWIRRPDPRVRSRLAMQGDRDSEVRARSAATYVLGQSERVRAVHVVRGRPLSPIAPELEHWQRFDVDGETVDVPMFDVGGDSWAVVPVANAVPVEVDATVMSIGRSPYNYYEHYF